jgi:hypothetical protein
MHITARWKESSPFDRLDPLTCFHFGTYLETSKSYRQLVGLPGRVISPAQGHYLHRTTQTQNKLGQTSLPRVGFEPTIPVLEWAKTLVAPVVLLTRYSDI